MTSDQPQEYIIDEELASLIEDALMNNPECRKCPNEGSGYNGAIVSHLRSRPASHASHTSAPERQLKDMKTLHDKECFMYGYREGQAQARREVLEIAEELSRTIPDFNRMDYIHMLKERVESLRGGSE